MESECLSHHGLMASVCPVGGVAKREAAKAVEGVTIEGIRGHTGMDQFRSLYSELFSWFVCVLPVSDEEVKHSL